MTRTGAVVAPSASSSDQELAGGEQTTRVEKILEAILRGAAKILGCMSATLIVISRKTGECRIRVGTLGTNAVELKDMETVFGEAVRNMVFRLTDVEDSLVVAAWRDRTSYETSSFRELVGNAFPTEAVEQAAALLGPQRFICVPVSSGGSRILGVIIFTKEDLRPFGAQQREILLRYAQRIGDIIDNDLRSHGQSLTREPGVVGDPIQAQLLQFALGDTAPALMVDPEYRITSVNEATTRLFGYEEEELRNQPISMLFRDPNDVETILNHQFLFLSSGYFEDVAVVRHNSGRVFPGKVKSLLLADWENRVVGFVVLIHDQSAIVEAGDSSNGVDHLMRRERLANMGELAAQLAHEIRNPLISIGATLDMMSRDPDGRPETNEMLGTLAREVTRVDLLLQDYLKLAARRGTTVVQVDVSELVEDACRLFNSGSSPGERSIITEIEPGLSLLGDYDGLRHVLLNLLRNAVEATPRDGQISCSAFGAERDVSILVEDQGPGLSCNVNECIKPFFTTKANGTGMGLTVCQKIVQAHGGTISLRNLQAGGCQASVVIPRKAMS